MFLRKTLVGFAILFTLLFTGCGGKSGGDSGSTPIPGGSSNWDQMVWDNNNWS